MRELVKLYEKTIAVTVLWLSKNNYLSLVQVCLLAVVYNRVGQYVSKFPRFRNQAAHLRPKELFSYCILTHLTID